MEVLVALALFALIGVAGFTLLDGVLRTQGATETRLARMAEVQRAMLVVSSDLDQLTGSISGSGGTLSLRKADLSGAIVAVRYDLNGQTLTRTVTGATGERVQTLIEGVSAAAWTFHRRRGDWLTTWPEAELPLPFAPVGAPAGPTRLDPDGGLDAVALDLTLTGLDGRPGATLRRVASIPLTDAPQIAAPAGPPAP